MLGAHEKGPLARASIAEAIAGDQFMCRPPLTENSAPVE